ncbi:alpha/beta hydrolase [Plantactinospora sp. S1510]|uniref:Alpha/beta hydrolase n=1 Tax=Plantactinospora alkalitolerans TaxID=2789879 RepID=A0ABS0GQ36_9ACTN|nr:alpha/beta hydrolase [Plantactinospora alkalitolerans]MBF9128313.1 alpha/beta hydrolase [Plantactinospora alkalitolerans]
MTATTGGTPELRTHSLERDGVRQVYHVAGTGPVCVVHSGGPGIEWKYLRMPALEEHLTMVYLEPVGTGASGRLADRREYRLETYERFVHAVVEALGVPKVYLLGHSHGGFVAQRYALAYPDRVAGLILYDTSPVTGPSFWAAAMAGVTSYPQRHPDRPEAATVPAAFEAAVTAADDESMTTELRRMMPVYFADYWRYEQQYAPLVASVRAWADPQRGEEPTPFDVRGRLASVTAPTLIMVGAHDFICGPHWAELLHEEIPGSRLTLLGESGHFGHIEQPGVFYPAVIDFIHQS